MPVLGRDSIVVRRFICKLRGGSQPILAEASDGKTYVVKFANNLQGPNVLFNESVGTELYRACGLPVPEWSPLRVTPDFLDKNPECWFQVPEGKLRPTAGLCFGSRFLGENGHRLLEVVPRTSFKRIRNPVNFWLAWLIDVCAEHVDNRQAVFTEYDGGWLDAHFVDFGHFFGGPKGDRAKNFRASRYLDARIYKELSPEALLQFKDVARAWDTDAFWRRLNSIPTEWRQASAIDSFERCLERLATPFLVRSVIETIVDDIEQKTESRNPGDERKSLLEVLRDGVQGAGLGWNLVQNPFGA